MKIFTRFSRVIAVLSALALLCSACVGAQPQQTALSASLHAPTRAMEMGRSFDLTLTLGNAGEQDAIVREIRLPAGILQAFNYLGSLPAVTLERAADGSGALRTQLVIPPASSAQFVLRFQTVFSGVYEEDFTVQFGEEMLQVPAHLEVKGSIPAGWKPGPASAGAQSELADGLPESAMVRVGAMVNVDGTLVKAWSASGVIISRDGLILTSARAVLGSRAYPVGDLIIALQSAPNTAPVDAYLASIVQVDEAQDAALIKPRSDLLGNPIAPGTLSLPFVQLAEESGVLPGEVLSLLGYESRPEALTRTLSAAVVGLMPEDGSAPLQAVLTELPPAGDYFGWTAFNARGELVGLASAPVGPTGLECGALADTNRDGALDDQDACLPVGGNLNTISSVQALGEMLDAAWAGQVGLQRASVSGVPFELQGQLVLETDFSVPLPAWPALEQTTARSGYEDGEYVLEAREAHQQHIVTLDYVYADLILSADTRVVSAAGDGDYGFVCGFQDASHFTALEVSEDGYFSIWKQTGDEISALVDWTYADVLISGKSLRLSAQCGADALRLAVNGLLLTEYTDPEFSSGLVGIIAGTYTSSQIKIAFDNLEILIPGAE